jgi:glycyl-tRNA synthetase alpha chain
MFLTRTRNVMDIEWAPGVKYGEVRKQDEYEVSKYGFETADTDLLRLLFEKYEAESRRCLEAGLVVPAYETALKCSHTFNLLDARGAVSATERVGVIKRVRDLAVSCAKTWVASREGLGFPLLPKEPAPEASVAEAEEAADV